MFLTKSLRSAQLAIAHSSRRALHVNVPQKPTRVLITGSSGQIGTELIEALRIKFGRENVIASDVKAPTKEQLDAGPFIFVDAVDPVRLNDIVKNEKIDWLIHNAAFLSAAAERHPNAALQLNTLGLHNVLNAALENNCRVMVPSSIAAFGPTTPLDNTPDFTIQRPISIYGIGKLYAELLGEYYTMKRGLDFRSLRYPGILSYKTLPGGGTTDYAVWMFLYALRGEHFECYIEKDTPLPMMYMPDCINATIRLMEAPSEKLKYRTYNVTAFSFTPEQLTNAIKKYVPSFTVSYKPDGLRSVLAKSWPNSLDDSGARRDWGWEEEYKLDAMVRDMLINFAKIEQPKVPFHL